MRAIPRLNARPVLERSVRLPKWAVLLILSPLVVFCIVGLAREPISSLPIDCGVSVVAIVATALYLVHLNKTEPLEWPLSVNACIASLVIIEACIATYRLLEFFIFN